MTITNTYAIAVTAAYQLATNVHVVQGDKINAGVWIGLYEINAWLKLPEQSNRSVSFVETARWYLQHRLDYLDRICG